MGAAETTPKDRGTVLAEQRTDLARHRTVIAAERTLMAWIRTALSMIGFGFSIYKFFQYQNEEFGNLRGTDAPRHLGMSLIAVGTLALAVAVRQHRDFLKDIGASQMRRRLPLPVAVAIVVVLIGLLTFFGVWLRTGPF